MLRTILLLGALSISNAYTCTIDGSEGLLPENDLNIPSSVKNVNIDEQTFHDVIDKVSVIYDPIIACMGVNLNVERKWDDGTVNAYASRAGGTWNVMMFGGLARHETVTPDGFALVVCHEIGHHIGGAPKKSTRWSASWASNEGQSDYFATLKCLRKVFANDNNEAVLAKMNVPKVVIDECQQQFSEKADQLICQRGSMAGQSVAFLFQALRNQDIFPKFDTPDAREVRRTDHNHPQTQCRMDTYYAGALCDKLHTDDVDQEDETIGVCHRGFGDTVGVRPRCWFKPMTDDDQNQEIFSAAIQ